MKTKNDKTVLTVKVWAKPSCLYCSHDIGEVCFNSANYIGSVCESCFTKISRGYYKIENEDGTVYFVKGISLVSYLLPQHLTSKKIVSAV